PSRVGQTKMRECENTTALTPETPKLDRGSAEGRAAHRTTGGQELHLHVKVWICGSGGARSEALDLFVLCAK
ncbi:hypothetical protein A2U01_0085815, partial [Trifolium medium]|nr:hypothetical protein [Trifolium medium]